MLVAGTAPEVRAAWRLMAVELVEGQLLDVTHTAGRRRDLPTSRRIARFKSGRYTITRPLQLGALVAWRRPRARAPARHLGRPRRRRLRRARRRARRLGRPRPHRQARGRRPALGQAHRPAHLGRRSCCPTTPARCSPPATPAPSTTPGSTRCSRRWSTPGCASGPSSAVADLVGAGAPRARRPRRRPRGRRRAARPRRRRRLAVRVRVVVIGAGLSGLAAACHLTAAGHDVTVLEREAIVGGRAGELRLGDFRIDTGPVVMTMPELLHAPIRAVGGDPEALVPMRRLDPAYRAVYPDGSELHIRADMGDLREEIRTKVGDADAAGFDRFLVWLEQLYETEFATFVDHNYSSPLDLVRSPATAARLLAARRARRARAGRRPVLHRRPAHPHLQLPGPVRRHRARQGPGRAGRHHLHGHRARRVLPRRRHARRAARAWRRRSPTPGCRSTWASR